MNVKLPNKQSFVIHGIRVAILSDNRLMMWDENYELNNIEIDRIIDYCINESILSVSDYEVLVKRKFIDK